MRRARQRLARSAAPKARFAIWLACGAALAAATGSATAAPPCQAGDAALTVGRIADLSSNLLGVQAFLEDGALASCLGFERVELSFAQADGCARGDRIEAEGRIALSDIGRRAYGGSTALVIEAEKAVCTPAR